MKRTNSIRWKDIVGKVISISNLNYYHTSCRQIMVVMSDIIIVTKIHFNYIEYTHSPFCSVILYRNYLSIIEWHGTQNVEEILVRWWWWLEISHFVEYLLVGWMFNENEIRLLCKGVFSYSNGTNDVR